VGAGRLVAGQPHRGHGDGHVHLPQQHVDPLRGRDRTLRLLGRAGEGEGGRGAQTNGVRRVVAQDLPCLLPGQSIVAIERVGPGRLGRVAQADVGKPLTPRHLGRLPIQPTRPLHVPLEGHGLCLRPDQVEGPRPTSSPLEMALGLGGVSIEPRQLKEQPSRRDGLDLAADRLLRRLPCLREPASPPESVGQVRVGERVRRIPSLRLSRLLDRPLVLSERFNDTASALAGR
jgi:hypothetical protein